MYQIDAAGRRRGPSRRPFPAPLLPLRLLLFLVLVALASTHAVFPFLPVLLVVLFFASRRRPGRVAAWRGDPPELGTATDAPLALPTSGISKEQELLEALERHGEITAARAALETSLSVAEAEEMLTGLSNKGHLRVSAMDGTLVYALWD